MVTRVMSPPGERDQHVQILLGAYILGGLPPDEAAAVAAHLGRCARCRAEHAELAQVPSWLDLLAESADSAAEQPDGT
jgi:anti-sigma factor RsiW